MNWDRLMWPLLAVFMGVLLLTTDSGKMFSLLKTPKDIYTCDVNSLKKGDHIKMDITTAYGCVMSNASIDIKDGERETNEISRYYAIPLIRENESSSVIYSFLVVEVSKDKYTALDTASSLFEGWWNDTSGLVTYPDEVLTSVNGVLKPVSEEEHAYIYAHFDSDEYGEYVIPYVLYCRTGIGDVIGCIIAMIFIIGGLIFTCRGIAKLRKENRAHTIAVGSGYYDVPENVTFDHKPQ